MSPSGSKTDRPLGLLYSKDGPFGVAMTGEFVAAWMPSVFVPLVGIMGPAVAMALLFNVIEATD